MLCGRSPPSFATMATFTTTLLLGATVAMAAPATKALPAFPANWVVHEEQYADVSGSTVKWAGTVCECPPPRLPITTTLDNYTTLDNHTTLGNHTCRRQVWDPSNHTTLEGPQHTHTPAGASFFFLFLFLLFFSFRFFASSLRPRPIHAYTRVSGVRR